MQKNNKIRIDENGKSFWKIENWNVEKKKGIVCGGLGFRQRVSDLIGKREIWFSLFVLVLGFSYYLAFYFYVFFPLLCNVFFLFEMDGFRWGKVLFWINLGALVEMTKEDMWMQSCFNGILLVKGISKVGIKYVFFPIKL